MKSELTLIIPTKNEKESLPVFLKELKKYCYKILIVVDPKDPHKYKIKKNKLISIKKQKKPGYGNALIEGINSTKTKYFSIINADGSMNPKDLDNKQHVRTFSGAHVNNIYYTQLVMRRP